MNDSYTLWSLLEKYDVVVPAIQRDYAQGRKDKRFIREEFFKDINSYLKESKQVTLDFVYGNVEGNRFYPLDGQQRLTTLWLIHWYVSFMAGKLREDKKILTKFSYEVRSSSEQFCKALCEKMVTANPTGNIAEYVKAQTWFYASWLQDPTICSMLRTISGDEESKDGSIEAVFDGDYSSYRENLLSGKILNFMLLVIGNEKLPISDDLYIKINARGKALSNFENFKADLVSWIQNPENPDSKKYEQSPIKNDTGIHSYKQYYSAQIDNKWTDVFFKSSKKVGGSLEGRIDEAYFSFINRFVVNEICLDKTLAPAEYAPNKESEDHREPKKAFDKLFGTGLDGASADDSMVRYEGFEIYGRYLTFDNMNKLDNLFNLISNNDILAKIEEELKINDADAEEDTQLPMYSFIPRYKSDNDIKLVSTRQKERVYFLAICLFLDNTKNDEDIKGRKFERWMRVIRNLVENAAIENVPAMVSCMRKIEEIAEKMRSDDNENDIYSVLNNYSDVVPDSRLESQLKEEIEKAKQIKTHENYEAKIKEAEQFSFFNGTIRFLYLNEESSVDWDKFDDKFKRAKELFNVKNNYNKVETKTITEFLKLFKGFNEVEGMFLFTSVGYHPRHRCWKRDILCCDDISEKVHQLLSGDTEEAKRECDYQEFLDSGLIDRIVEKYENYRFRYHWHNGWAIHKERSQTEGVYVSEERKVKCEVLNRLAGEKQITVLNDNFNFYCKGYYWGLCVAFEHEGKKYYWRSEYDSNSKKSVDKLYKTDADSKDYVIWEKPEDLIVVLTSKPLETS